MALFNHQVEQLLNLVAMNLAINYLQFSQLVWDVFTEKRLQTLNRKCVDLIALVNDRFKVFDGCEALENHGESISRQTTIVEKSSVHLSMINVIACFAQPLTLSIAQHVVLQTQRFSVYFFKNWQE